jgi:hypothetical protein
MADNRSAEQKYKDFYATDKVKKIQINIPGSLFKKLIYLGKATEVSYANRKWGRKKTPYRHTLKKQGDIFTNRAGTMFLILNTKIDLKKEGIVG